MRTEESPNSIQLGKTIETLLREMRRDVGQSTLNIREGMLSGLLVGSDSRLSKVMSSDLISEAQEMREKCTGKVTESR